MAEIVSCTDEFESTCATSAVWALRKVSCSPESEPSAMRFTPCMLQVTGRGARSGLAAGAVSHYGCVLNTSRMNRVSGMRRARRPLLCACNRLLLMEPRDIAEGEFRHGGLER